MQTLPPALICRVNRELSQLAVEPPTGIAAWPKDDRVTEAEAQIQGPADTPYQGGVFRLSINIPTRYPFEPPAIQFLTKIYHPNIDNQGRICLDSLKMPPTGSWQPSLNLTQLLSQIRILMSEPNPDDPLMSDINEVFRMNRNQFDDTAKLWTKRYAQQRPAEKDSPKSELPTQEPGVQGQVPEQKPGMPTTETALESDGEAEESSSDEDEEEEQHVVKRHRIA